MIEIKNGQILKMKLVCFSNNTAGGLVCDLLNNNFDKMLGFRTINKEHSALKVGDTNPIQRKLDVELWNQKIKYWRNSNCWLGTHAHPSIIPDLSIFDEVIAITTLTRKSKFYRWLRCYHGWFLSANPHWKETDSLTEIDKIRNLAKNVFEDFEPHSQCKNIEFEDIVEGRFVKYHNLNQDYFNNWQKNNPWLYNNLETWAVKRFNEAEYEIITGTPFKYI